MITEPGCDCEHRKRLKKLWGRDKPAFNGEYEYCAIEQCRDCGKLWKTHYQYDPGIGSDNFSITMGEMERGMSFTEEEAVVALNEYCGSGTWWDAFSSYFGRR